MLGFRKGEPEGFRHVYILRTLSPRQRPVEGLKQARQRILNHGEAEAQARTAPPGCPERKELEMAASHINVAASHACPEHTYASTQQCPQRLVTSDLDSTQS